MANIRIAIAAAFMLCAFLPASPAQALDCKHTLAQYTDAMRSLQVEAAQARAMADQNPLYESDVAYYGSVLRTAQACVKQLTPLVSASR